MYYSNRIIIVEYQKGGYTKPNLKGQFASRKKAKLPTAEPNDNTVGTIMLYLEKFLRKICKSKVLEKVKLRPPNVMHKSSEMSVYVFFWVL